MIDWWVVLGAVAGFMLGCALCGYLALRDEASRY